jgi:hypothetical protein
MRDTKHSVPPMPAATGGDRQGSLRGVPHETRRMEVGARGARVRATSDTVRKQPDERIHGEMSSRKDV